MIREKHTCIVNLRPEKAEARIQVKLMSSSLSEANSIKTLTLAIDIIFTQALTYKRRRNFHVKLFNQ